MTPEEMKAKLTEQLEFWNSMKGHGEKLDNIMTARMEGMIHFAISAMIITEEEKSELNYIYFGENY